MAKPRTSGESSTEITGSLATVVEALHGVGRRGRRHICRERTQNCFELKGCEIWVLAQNFRHDAGHVRAGVAIAGAGHPLIARPGDAYIDTVGTVLNGRLWVVIEEVRIV